MQATRAADVVARKAERAELHERTRITKACRTARLFLQRHRLAYVAASGRLGLKCLGGDFAYAGKVYGRLSFSGRRWG